MDGIIHTRIGTALRDWTTWAACTVGAALGAGGMAEFFPEPWGIRAKVGGAALALLGTLIRGPGTRNCDNA